MTGLIDKAPKLPDSPRNYSATNIDNVNSNSNRNSNKNWNKNSMEERMIDLSRKLKDLEINYSEYRFNTREFRNPKFYDLTKNKLGLALDWVNETKICSNLDRNIFNKDNFLSKYDSCHVLIKQFDSAIQAHQEKVQAYHKMQKFKKRQHKLQLQQLQQLQHHYSNDEQSQSIIGKGNKGGIMNVCGLFSCLSNVCLFFSPHAPKKTNIKQCNTTQ